VKGGWKGGLETGAESLPGTFGRRSFVRGTTSENYVVVLKQQPMWYLYSFIMCLQVLHFVLSSSDVKYCTICMHIRMDQHGQMHPWVSACIRMVCCMQLKHHTTALNAQCKQVFTNRLLVWHIKPIHRHIINYATDPVTVVILLMFYNVSRIQYVQSRKKIAGKKCKICAEFVRKLHWKCAKIARKLRAICTQIELKNPLKTGEKLPESWA